MERKRMEKRRREGRSGAMARAMMPKGKGQKPMGILSDMMGKAGMPTGDKKKY